MDANSREVDAGGKAGAGGIHSDPFTVPSHACFAVVLF